MRDYGETLSFAPRLPSRLSRLSFGLVYRGRRLRVAVHADRATYELLDGEPLEVAHDGETVTVAAGKPVKRRPAAATGRANPGQPPGREPWRHDGG
jgi:alpha,alpha-trehalose phosphorylase